MTSRPNGVSFPSWSSKELAIACWEPARTSGSAGRTIWIRLWKGILVSYIEGIIGPKSRMILLSIWLRPTAVNGRSSPKRSPAEHKIRWKTVLLLSLKREGLWLGRERRETRTNSPNKLWRMSSSTKVQVHLRRRSPQIQNYILRIKTNSTMRIISLLRRFSRNSQLISFQTLHNSDLLTSVPN